MSFRFKILVDRTELKRLRADIAKSIDDTGEQVAIILADRAVAFLRKFEGRQGARRARVARGWRRGRPMTTPNRTEIEVDNFMAAPGRWYAVRSNARGRRVTGRISGRALLSILIYGADEHRIEANQAKILSFRNSSRGRIGGRSAVTRRGAGRFMSKRDRDAAGFTFTPFVDHPGVIGSQSIPKAVALLKSIRADTLFRAVKVEAI